jgi:DNA-binding MarR family transcriptional regulator
MSSRPVSPRRSELLEELAAAGREHSAAIVLFHAALGARLGLGATDEKILDFVQREGVLGAGELVRRTGLAPSSISAALDRLEERGFVRRSRDSSDHRRVLVEFRQERLAEALPLFEGLSRRLDELYAGYDDGELAVILDFMRRTAVLQRAAAAELSDSG